MSDRRLESARRKAQRRAKRDLDRRTKEASKTVAKGLFSHDPIQVVADTAVDALMIHEGRNGRMARKRAAKGLELHLICALAWTSHQSMADIQGALTLTVAELIECALMLPDRPSTTRGAVVAGVKDAFAEELASEATTVFMESLGAPSADHLRLIAIMFCPNSDAHPKIRALEKELGEEIAAITLADELESRPPPRSRLD